MLKVKIDSAIVGVIAEKNVRKAVVTKMICPVSPSGARCRAKRALASHQQGLKDISRDAGVQKKYDPYEPFIGEDWKVIKVSVFYPNDEGSNFDMNYYCNNHIPMVQEKLGSACKRVEVEQGLSGADPGSRATFTAIGHLYFDSVKAFQTAFGPHAQAIMGDIPNYTDIQPTLQISEVKI